MIPTTSSGCFILSSASSGRNTKLSKCLIFLSMGLFL